MPDTQEGMQVDREGVVVREIDPIPITRREVGARSGCDSIARSIHGIFNLVAAFTIERGLVLRNACYEYFADVFDFILQRAARVCRELGVGGDIAQGILMIESRFPGAYPKIWYFLPREITFFLFLKWSKKGHQF